MDQSAREGVESQHLTRRMICTLTPSFKHSVRSQALCRKERVQRSSLDDIVVTTTSVVASVSFALSSLQLLNTVARLPVNAEQSLDNETDLDNDEDAFVWSVATVVSLIPVFNFMVRPFLSPRHLKDRQPRVLNAP